MRKALTEHKQIRKQVQDIKNNSENSKRKSLTKLADMVDNHVRYEERVLFRHLELKLSKAQLEDIGRKVQNLPAPLPDEFEDQFWNIN